MSSSGGVGGPNAVSDGLNRYNNSPNKHRRLLTEFVATPSGGFYSTPRRIPGPAGKFLSPSQDAADVTSPLLLRTPNAINHTSAPSSTTRTGDRRRTGLGDEEEEEQEEGVGNSKAHGASGVFGGVEGFGGVDDAAKRERWPVAFTSSGPWKRLLSCLRVDPLRQVPSSLLYRQGQSSLASPSPSSSSSSSSSGLSPHQCHYAYRLLHLASAAPTPPSSSTDHDNTQQQQPQRRETYFDCNLSTVSRLGVSGKVERLFVVVKTLRVCELDGFAVLSDPFGEVPASLHRKVGSDDESSDMRVMIM